MHNIIVWINKIYSSISSKIKVGFLTFIILTTVILATPLPISWKPFHYKEEPLKVDLTSWPQKDKAPFPIPNKIDAFGKSLLSSLVGIEVGSMPTYVCITNTSSIIYPEGQVDPIIFLKEGGLADIYVNINQDSAGLSIKIPLATSTCEYITARKESGIANEVTWGVRPTADLKNVIFNISTKIGFKFNKWTYIKNLLLSLGGLIIVLSSCIQVWQFLRKRD